ncbi:hypothetical protein H2200_002440 [Cladophialophora chaetospira]|uniref:Major facilitator superfamily (MFS) profile domain-containing protein n=1 Tax=Cladophialophora chaetospira TaxID=386627 RepID=A0AA39CN23_9EURO|nr:hypothetical protein H2200_002440 [Cladophialophora chaetospira]
MAKLTVYNIRVCAVVTIAAFSYGFGASVFVTSVGQPGFFEYYKLDPQSLHTADILSAINATFFAGCGIGALLQCWAADRVGRRGALAIAAAFSLVGSALVAGSVHIAMLSVMRVIQGIGLGMLLALVPLYLTEVAPPKHRGVLTGSTQFSTGIGYIICSFGSIGCYHATNRTLSWRLPLALACVGPLGLLIGLLFVPGDLENTTQEASKLTKCSESPRYLIWQGKREEAWDVLKRLHHDPANLSESDAGAEFTQIMRQVELDKEDKFTFLKMFQKPSWRRRSMLAMALLFAQQGSGVYGLVNFFPLSVSSLGLTGDVPLILYACLVTAATIAIAFAMWMVDRFGRRALLLTGFASVACVLFIAALLQWKYQGSSNKAGKEACIFSIFLFIVVFQCIDAPTFVWASEIFPTGIRAKGVSLALFSYFVGVVTFSTPAASALQTIKWGMIMIYAGFCVIFFIFTYLYIPETKGLPIEEIGALFGDSVAVHLTSDGDGIVEEKQNEFQIENSATVAGEKV